MRWDTDLVGKQGQVQSCATCKLNGQCGCRSAAVHAEWYQMHSRDIQMRQNDLGIWGRDKGCQSLASLPGLFGSINQLQEKRKEEIHTNMCCICAQRGWLRAGKGNGEHRQEGMVGECICTHQSWQYGL
jgi:hypothetical protein